MLGQLLVTTATAFGVARFVTPVQVFGFWPAFITILLVFNSAWLFYSVYVFPYRISPMRNIPGPNYSNLLFGVGKEEVGQTAGVIHAKWRSSMKSPHAHFMRYIGFFGEEKVVPTSAAALKQIMHDRSFESPEWWRLGGKTLLGDGLVFAEGHRHEYMRKAIAPAFTPAQVRRLTPVFWETAQDLTVHLTKCLTPSADNEKRLSGEINIMQWVDRMTFDMIGKSAFGHDFKALEDPNQGLYKTYNDMYPLDGYTKLMDFLCMFVFPIFIPHDICNMLPIQRFQEQLASRQSIERYCAALIREQEAAQLGRKISDGDHTNLLSALVQNKKLSNPELVENMMTMTAAGYGTNSATLSWAMYALAAHPRIQSTLRTEIHTHLPTSSTPLSAQSMDSMKYLHHVIMETYRLYPAIPGFFREATADRVVADQLIPKGTQLLVAPFLSNRLEEHWGPDAADFVPERWGAERYVKGMEYSGVYTTFNLGAKNCVGKEYSLRALKAALIALVGGFEWGYDETKGDPIENLVPGLTLRAKGGLTLRVEKVEGW